LDFIEKVKNGSAALIHKVMLICIFVHLAVITQTQQPNKL